MGPGLAMRFSRADDPSASRVGIPEMVSLDLIVSTNDAFAFQMMCLSLACVISPCGRERLCVKNSVAQRIPNKLTT